MATSSSSSAKKVAKLAQRGKGKKVRFQGGSLFPIAVIVVILMGLVTIVYARQSRPDPGSQPPQVGDHWHAAYGMYVCDTWLPTLDGAKEEQTVDPSTGQEVLADSEFSTTGVHSHDDGVIHYHPYSTKSVGSRAKLGLFLDVYDVELSTDELKLPEEQGGEDYRADDFQCDGKDVQITVTAWNNYTDTGEGTTYITDLDDVRITEDGMVFAVAIAPAGTEIKMPPWAANLPELGAADGSGQVPGAGDTISPDVTDVSGTGEPVTDPAGTGDTTVDTTPSTGTTPATAGGTAPPASAG